MRLPLSWLKDFISAPGAPEALAERLTVAGIPVARIERSAIPASVVIGHVRNVKPHPNADRLRVATVDLGQRRATIVCGAPNLAVGQKVAVAQPGTTLPNGMTIRAAAIRGVTSEGMICAEDELGIGSDHTGIVVLSATATVGTPAATALPHGDTVFDLEVTPNRADCLSVLGCAREIAALTKKTVRAPKEKRLVTPQKLSIRHLSIQVQDRHGCPFYSARVIDGVSVQPSPPWMQERLLAAGVRPQSNVIDVTNYVMLERGQPLHAFDASALSDNALIVRRARAGESIAALDGKTHALTPETLVIASSAGPVAIAGIMGGQQSGISQTTVRVVLEAAVFDPVRVRTTSKRIGLSSESSYRFERGVDGHTTLAALDRAASLIAELAGGTVLPGRAVVGRQPVHSKPIPLSVDRTNALLSLSLAPSAIASALQRLGATVRGRGKRLRVTPPTWRRDLTIEEDLIEEVGRIVGYPELSRTLPSGVLAPVDLPPLWRFKHDLSDALTAAGGVELKNHPFVPNRVALKLFPTAATAVRVLNPLNREQSLLRTELLPGLLLKAGLAGREQAMLFLYEIGRCFAESEATLPAETERVALVVLGPDPYRRLKGKVLTALDTLGILRSAVRRTVGDHGEIFLLGNRPVGHLTLLDADTRNRFKILGDAAAAELLLEPLVPLRRPPVARPLPRFPSLRRDLAFWIPQKIRYADVEKLIIGFDPLLVGSELFDIYDAPGRRSLALHLTFQSPSRTLTSEDVERVVTRLVNKLTSTVHAQLRTA